MSPPVQPTKLGPLARSAIVVDHDGVRCALLARIDQEKVYPAVFSVVLALAGAILWASGSWPAAAAAAAVAGLLMFAVVPRSRRTWLSCDGRVVRWKRWGRSERAMSLLDLHRVYPDDRGSLVLHPHPGPLDQVTIGAHETSHADLEHLARILNEAIAQAEKRRGDRPTQEHWAVSGMLERQPTAGRSRPRAAERDREP